MCTLAIHYGLDYGLVARYLGREYMGQYSNFVGTIAILEPHVTADDLCHIKRTLSQGCPQQLVWEETRANKMAALRKGNQKSVTDFPDVVAKALNKEE